LKKITRKIALLLIIIILSNILAGCLSWWLMTGEPLDLSGFTGRDSVGLIFLPIIDIILLIPALIVFSIRMAIEAERNERGDRIDGIDTFSAVSSLSEKNLVFLKEKFFFLPEGKLSSLMNRFDFLSEAQIAPFLKTAADFSETQFSAIMNEFFNYSDEEIASSIEMLNSMPQEFFITTLNNLQFIEFRSAR